MKIDITDHLPLVHHIAQKFRNRAKAARVEYDDVFQVGCIGLIKAAKHFDPDRGFKFATYAVPMIQYEIIRYFRDSTTLLHFQRHEKHLAWETAIHSLDQIIPTPGNDRGDTTADIIPSFEDFTAAEVDDFISGLDKRDQVIVREKLDDRTQAEIGRRIGVSQVQVSRRIVKIRDKLAAYVAM